MLIDQGLDPPFSCRQGICGACACQLTAGQVEMAHNEVLEADDVADGYVLACQSVARTPEVSITYWQRRGHAGAPITGGNRDGLRILPGRQEWR